MTNIVTVFLETAKNKTPAGTAPGYYALELIEKMSGRKVTHSRVKEWERGSSRLPPEVYNVMMNYVLDHDEAIQAGVRNGGVSLLSIIRETLIYPTSEKATSF